MFASTAKILETVQVLEKVAQLFEHDEREEQRQRVETLKKDFIEPIREVSNLPASLEEKLASADPEVLGFIRSMAKERQNISGGYQSLGGPDLEKNAREDYNDPLLAFMMGDD